MSRPTVQPELGHESHPRRFWSAFRHELRPTLGLALPVILAELGWMGMGLADMFMVGPLGPEAIGAVGLGNVLFFTIAIFGYGLLLGMDTEVSQSFGAGRLVDCHRTLANGVYLAFLITPFLTLSILALFPFLGSWGIDPAILRLLRPYLWVSNWCMLPLLVYAALRRYLQGMGLMRPIMYALVSANLVNILGNWVLVYGHWGFPVLGVEGSAWATFVARVYKMLFLAGAIILHTRRQKTGLWRAGLGPELKRIRRLLALGLPAAIQVTLEVGVFAIAASLAGRLGPAALAAHEIALNVCGFTFMVPLGISSAGSVRVGQAIGRGDPEAAVVSGWAALGLGAMFMSGAATAFLLIPRTIIGLYTNDSGVLATGITLLAVAAAFQLFDGVQVVATGNLRGVGDTKTPMFANLLAHWGIGLPIGFVLGFLRGWGVLGIWIGLSTGLIVAGGLLVHVWSRRARTMRVEGVAAASAKRISHESTVAEPGVSPPAEHDATVVDGSPVGSGTARG